MKNLTVRSRLFALTIVLLSFAITVACSTPAPAVQIRIANFSNVTFNDVQVQFADDVVSIGDMLPHSNSDYQTQAGVPAELALSFSTGDQQYSLEPISTGDAVPLPEGDYTYVLQLVNDELQHIMLNDSEPHFDEALAGYWLWTEVQLASSETIIPQTDGREPSGMLLTKSPSMNAALEGQLFGAYTGCSSAGGAFFTTPNNQLVMHMIEFGGEECMDEIISAENLLLQAINGITTYTVNDDMLSITLTNGDVLIFSRN